MNDKVDPYKHKEKYLAWKERVKDGIPEISKFNSDLVIQYLNDMENGFNVARGSSKGSRSFIRLNTLRDKLCFFAKKFKELYNCERIIDIKEEQLVCFFSNMKNGSFKKAKGGVYTSVDTYAKAFKAFWHWYQKVNHKKGIEVSDITIDLDTKQEKPDWVYLTEEQIKRICDHALFDYKVLIMFLFDSGIRAPTELMNVRVSDLYNSFKELNIREETAKTFGRRINLMLCSDLLKEYIKQKNLKPEDYLFTKTPFKVNEYLKRLAVKILGDGMSPAGQKYSELTMYDFRHCSCCYWLPKYKQESALMYRFGWTKSDKIHYYSEMLGMKDTITQEDLLTGASKTEIERDLDRTKRENQLLQEKMSHMESQMQKILEMVNVVGGRV